MDFVKELKRKIVVFDGAMGTMLMSQGKQGALELLNITEPDVVAAVHEAYLKAGADIITTNTTCADALSLAEYGLQERSYELARAGAQVARRAVEKYSTTLHPRFVAGAVGPTSRNITLANDTTAEQLAEVYATQIRGLIDGGVDVILLETAMDARNVQIAVEQVRKQSETMSIILSAVLSRLEGRVASGATIKKFMEDVPLSEVAAVGFNCSMGTKQMEVALQALSAECKLPVVLYPACAASGQSASQFVKPLDRLARAGGLNIVGGCCGTTPEHIELLARSVARWRPRKF